VAPLSHDDNDELRICRQVIGRLCMLCAVASVTNQKLDAAFKGKRRLRGELIV